MRRFVIILSIAAAACPLFGCGDSGVKDPEAWLRENISYLNEVVNKLRDSSIIRVQVEKYEDAAKFSSSERDEKLYYELKKFMDSTGAISIEVVRDRVGDDRKLKAVSFHVKEISKFADLTEVSVIYVERGVNPERFFFKPACKLASEDWYVCTAKPR